MDLHRRTPPARSERDRPLIRAAGASTATGVSMQSGVIAGAGQLVIHW
jgi:hypothetical protein